MGLHHTKAVCSFNLLQLLNKVRDEMGVLNGRWSPKFFLLVAGPEQIRSLSRGSFDCEVQLHEKSDNDSMIFCCTIGCEEVLDP